MTLAESRYRLTRQFPRGELFGLTSQIRRAVGSVPAKTAEGHGREHLGDYLRSLSIANGSLMDLETHLLIGRRMNYVPAQDEQGFLQHAAEVGRMLAGLVRALKRRSNADTRHLTPDTYFTVAGTSAVSSRTAQHLSSAILA